MSAGMQIAVAHRHTLVSGIGSCTAVPPPFPGSPSLRIVARTGCLFSAWSRSKPELSHYSAGLTMTSEPGRKVLFPKRAFDEQLCLHSPKTKERSRKVYNSMVKTKHIFLEFGRSGCGCRANDQVPGYRGWVGGLRVLGLHTGLSTAYWQGLRLEAAVCTAG